MMGKGEESRMNLFHENTLIHGNGNDAVCETGSCPGAPENRRDGLSLECAFCVYYEILRSLEPGERLMFFKITSLADHLVIFQELFDELL
jgi:hypothetical protein